MLQSIERYMKQAIVDKDPSVSSAALTSSLVLDLFILVYKAQKLVPVLDSRVQCVMGW